MVKINIRSEIGQQDTITEGYQALELFKDRVEAVCMFMSYIHGDIPAGKIIFFHGDAGYGKSLLLRYLRKNCCKKFENIDTWDYIKSRESKDFIDNIPTEADYLPVPSSFIDFGQQPWHDYNPKEAYSALLKMRRDLSGNKLHFPLFDFACIWYLHKACRLNWAGAFN